MDKLKLDNQLCFPLYACSKEIIKSYTPFLEKIDLTYTQYLVMLVLWEHDEINVKNLGKKLFLDSGTLTPLLKKLENKGYILRKRNTKDERNLIIKITDKGKIIKNKAEDIPSKISSCLSLTNEEALTLYKILYKLLNEKKDE